MWYHVIQPAWCSQTFFLSIFMVNQFGLEPSLTSSSHTLKLRAQAGPPSNKEALDLKTRILELGSPGAASPSVGRAMLHGQASQEGWW